MNTRPGRLCISASALAALLLDPQSAAAQSIAERARAAAMTVVAATDQNPAGRLLWTLERPVSFSLLGAETSRPLSGLIGQALSSSLNRDDCLDAHFEAFEAIAEVDPVDLEKEIADLETAFLDETGLSDTELATYKEYKARYDAELKRLSALAKDEAEAEAHILRQIETDWEIFGYRNDFAPLEDRIAEAAAARPKIDAAALRASVVSDEGALNYALSVPIEQWQTFDSWVYHRKTGAVDEIPAARNIELPKSSLFNKGSCQPGSCERELEPDPFVRDAIALEILAPRIELPWLTEFRVAASLLPEPVEGCEMLDLPDRLILLRSVGTPYERNSTAVLVEALEDARPFDVDGLQFSGSPDIGSNYRSSPIFMNGGLTSPFAFIFGFTTQTLHVDGR